MSDRFTVSDRWSPVRLELPKTVLAEAVHRVGQQLDRLEQVEDDDRFAGVELEVSLARGGEDRGVIPEYLQAPMISDSAWVGFAFPGLIDDPGSFAGIWTSPSAIHPRSVSE